MSHVQPRTPWITIAAETHQNQRWLGCKSRKVATNNQDTPRSPKGWDRKDKASMTTPSQISFDKHALAGFLSHYSPTGYNNSYPRGFGSLKKLSTAISSYLSILQMDKALQHPKTYLLILLCNYSLPLRKQEQHLQNIAPKVPAKQLDVQGIGIPSFHNLKCRILPVSCPWNNFASLQPPACTQKQRLFIFDSVSTTFDSSFVLEPQAKACKWKEVSIFGPLESQSSINQGQRPR